MDISAFESEAKFTQNGAVRWLAMGVAQVLCWVAVAPAQVQPVDAEFEGRVTAIVPGDGTVGAVDRISVMGAEIVVPANTPIHSPTATLTFTSLLGSPFPGRVDPGFLNGTAIVSGTTVNGVTTATNIEIEPAENLLAGAVTANNLGVISILGVPVMLLSDPRMDGHAANEDGFAIDVTTIAVGSFAVAEGYLGDDGVFHAHTIEAEGTILGGTAQTSIMVARCSNGGTLHVRGSSTTPSGVVWIFDNITNQQLAIAVVEPNADNPSAGTYRITIPWQDMVCVTQVRVENSNGSQAVRDVTIQ